MPLYRRSAGSTLGDGPHHERLTPASVAAGKDAGHVGHVLVVAGHVGPRVEFRSGLIHDVFRILTGEAEGQEHEIRRNDPLTSRFGPSSAVVTVFRVGDLETGEDAVLPHEFDGRREVCLLYTSDAADE